MPNITYKQQTIALTPQQTVLEGLLEAGHDIPNACRAGACQSCKLQAKEGEIPKAVQQSLSASEQKMGYFLSCLCKPQEDLILLDHQHQPKLDAQIIEHQALNDTTVRLRLAPVFDFDFEAGQYFTIWHRGELPRSYSIASSPNEGFIECHIKLIADGAFSPFAYHQLKAGDSLLLQGPMGHCIYAPASPEQPLLLAGLGTGLAPIFGIAKKALAEGHTGPIHLIAGAKSPTGLYYRQELETLADKHRNFRFQQLVHGGSTGDIMEADIYDYCKAQHPNTQGYGIYLCGAASFVHKLKKQCFLAGASMQQIYADAFLPCTNTQ